MATIILSENMFNEMISEFSNLNESSDRDNVVNTIKNSKEAENYLKSVIRDCIKNDSEVDKTYKQKIKNDRDLEKRVKNITADVMEKFFKTLWQRAAFYSGEIRN